MSSIADMRRIWALEEQAVLHEARLAELEGSLRSLAQLYTELEVRLDSPRPQPQAQRAR